MKPPQVSIDIDSLRNNPSLDYELVFKQIGLCKEIGELIKQKFSANRNRLDRNQFADLYKQINVVEEKPSTVDYSRKQVSDLVFRLFDLNHDENLTIREFIIGMAVTACGSIKQKVEYAFSVYDSDNDGVLSRSDIKIGLREIYALVGVNHIDEIISGYIDKFAKTVEIN